MFVKKLLFVFIILCSSPALKAQITAACTMLGQTPPTAFPVCGTSVFKQDNVPICTNHTIPVACHDGAPYADKNPFWYKFTCFKGGTLGFMIVPNTVSDDYDWQLFDITGHNPTEVYTNTSLFVSGNWSSNPDSTGTSASAAGNGSLNCAGPGYPNKNAMPVLVQGHQYLLLVSHFTDTQSGYSLFFGGGTASITDTTAPALKAAQADCDGTRVTVLLNKKMKCSSLDPNGSDFSLSPSPFAIIAASANTCSSGFDMDTLTLTLNGPLPLGNYTIIARNGVDGNTLLDNCNVQIPAGASVPFAIVPLQPTPMDSLTPPECAPGTLQLVFKKQIRCSTIAADGSDFIVSGPSPVSVTGARGNCGGNGESSVILVKLASPIVIAGLYRIKLVSGSDGNTIIDKCGKETPAGATLEFTTKDTVSAVFNDQVLYGCRNDTIVFTYPEKNGVNQWQWIFNNTDTSLLKDPVRIFPNYGRDTVQLIVSNGFCSDTAKTIIRLDNGVRANFEASNLLCPKDEAVFKNNSIGPVSSWNWDFGDGTGSSFQLPPDHHYPMTGVEKKYAVTLIVQNIEGCGDTAVHEVDVLRTCYIAVPSAFTPNGDGMNDYLYPLNAYKADNLEFRVYNRYGQLVFKTNDWTKKWDGKIGGQPQPPGTFVWTLQYTDRDTGKKFFEKGVSVLIR